MLIIKSKQFQAFDAASIRRLENELNRYLWKFNPKHCDVLGKSGVNTVIQRSMKKANSYGFTNKGPMRQYMELVFIFGSDFDTDPIFPWAGRILRDNDKPDQMLRVERLHVKALEYIDATAGEDFRYENEALHLVRSFRYENLAVPHRNFEEGCLDKLQFFYPRKYAYVGEPVLQRLIHAAKEQARDHSVTTQQGILFLAALMFFMGHGFAEDPLFPWIKSTLTDSAIRDPNKRVERLHAKTMDYLDHFLLN